MTIEIAVTADKVAAPAPIVISREAAAPTLAADKPKR